MEVFRTQKNIPAVYYDESRDFQLLGRLYDVMFNSAQYNATTIKHILNTDTCNNNLLSLLQTKLGFFSNKNFNNEELRLILKSFPDMVKNKGSVLGIKYAVSTYLKILGLQTDCSIMVTEDSIDLDGIQIADHTLIIGIKSDIQDTTSLQEMFKYILPVGYDYYIYFYNDVEVSSKFATKDKVRLLLILDSQNSLLQ